MHRTSTECQPHAHTTHTVIQAETVQQTAETLCRITNEQQTKGVILKLHSMHVITNIISPWIHFILVATSKAKLKGRRGCLKLSGRFWDGRSCISCERNLRAHHWGFVADCTACQEFFWRHPWRAQALQWAMMKFYLGERLPLVTMPMTVMK